MVYNVCNTSVHAFLPVYSVVMHGQYSARCFSVRMYVCEWYNDTCKSECVCIYVCVSYVNTNKFAIVVIHYGPLKKKKKKKKKKEKKKITYTFIKCI